MLSPAGGDGEDWTIATEQEMAAMDEELAALQNQLTVGKAARHLLLIQHTVARARLLLVQHTVARARLLLAQHTVARVDCASPLTASAHLAEVRGRLQLQRAGERSAACSAH
jgi:hypothetical protein